MPYPSELLPKPGYKIIEDVGVLSDSHNLYIVRRLNKDPKGLVKEDIELFDFVDKPYNLNNLSCNLLGIKFDHNQLSFRLNSKEWFEGDRVDISETHDAIEITAPFVPIFWAVSVLHDVETQVRTSPSPKKGHLMVEALGPQAQPSEIGRSKLLHKPTRCNYWHFQLHFYDSLGNIVSKNKDAKYFEEDMTVFFKIKMHANLLLFHEIENNYSTLEPIHYSNINT